MLGRYKGLLAAAVLLVAIAYDRELWAQVAQWREDQACQLWIGYTQPITHLPVGLISSVGTPNPNGMPLLAAALTLLPNLLAVSTALGFIQGALVVWVCSLLVRPSLYWIALAFPVLSSVLLGATSVEFWNNWILASFNLAFFGCYLTYLQRRSLWPLVGCLALILLAPAVYLAGLVNALVYSLFVAALLVRQPPDLRSWADVKRSALPLLAGVFVFVFFLVITWLPYAHAIKGQELPVSPLTLDSAIERLARATDAALEFPRWALMHWYRHTNESFLQNSRQIIGAKGEALLTLSNRLLLAQGSLCLIALACALVHRLRRSSKTEPDGLFVYGERRLGNGLLAALALVWISLLISPLIGGPSWHLSERGDQQVQFLPLLFLAWFALPLVLRLPNWLRWGMIGATALLTVAFTAVNVKATRHIVEAHLDYDGPALTPADIPLVQHRAVARFIARDWMRISHSKQVPVFYQHGQEWVYEFGKALLRWYPAPMNVGRSFDFELRRVYGLENTQEGVQVRSAKNARYIVTYATRPPPHVVGAKFTHYKLDRFRVTVVERGVIPP